MNFVLWPCRCSSSINRHSKWLLLAAVVATASGCGREEIQVYNAPKEPVKTVAQAPSRSMGLPPARPQVTWTLPKGWQESGAGQMSVASFSIKGEGSAEAQVTITPLTKLAGRDAEIVNMWREQVGLAALDREEALKQFEKVDVGGESGSLFSIEGKPEGQSAPARIITAMVHREDASWFYKLSGDGVVVAAQKPAFLEFLKSIRLKEAPMTASAPAPATAPADTGSGAKPNWTVPAQWKELAAGQMQIARFAVPERGGAKAEVFVSVFPNDTGGTLANVNRWRRQLGLSELNESELGSIVSPLDPASPGAILVEMTSSSKKMFGAVVPRNGSYWFYKLLGDAEAVAPEKEAFVAFAKSKP